MADYTTNYNLKKPTSSEYYNVQDSNGNMDLIDTELKSQADDITELKNIGNEVTISASSDLLLTWANKFVRSTTGSDITITIEPDSSIAHANGTEIVISQYGAGIITFAEGTGVTINSFDGALSTGGQYATVTLRKIGTDEWLLIGNLA